MEAYMPPGFKAIGLELLPFQELKNAKVAFVLSAPT